MTLIQPPAVPLIIPLRQVPVTSSTQTPEKILSAMDSTKPLPSSINPEGEAATSIRVEPPDPRVRWAKESVLRTAESHRLSLNSKIARWREELGLPGEEKSAAHLDLLAHLKQIEWGGRANEIHFICPACGASRAIGHEVGCWVGAVLA